MKLINLIGLKSEVKSVLDNYKKVFNVKIYDEEIHLLKDLKIEKDMVKNGLLVATTDETIALGKALGIATVAYANSDFPNQSYGGVEMIVEGFEEVDADFFEKVYQRWHHLPWIILETRRCVVRELSLEDMEALFELYEDEEMARYTEGLYPYEEEMEYQRAYINNMYRYFGYGMWLVFSKETGKVIGRAGLEHREYYEQTELELGYLIGKKYQGQGYATEICKAILEYAKENTGFERINSLIEEGNESSIKLIQKLNFEYIEDYDLDGKKVHRFVKNLKED